MNHILFSSARSDWPTPLSVFELLDREFHFCFDVAASADNALCSKFFTVDDDSLSRSWPMTSCWCDPPYSRQLGRWIQKAYLESLTGSLVVMLVPSRTDTSWFHDYVLPYAEIRFLRGRLRFGSSRNNAPFGSMVLVFRPPSF